MKFLPRGPYTQLVRSVTYAHPLASTARSPASFVRPYALKGFTASLSTYGHLPVPSNT